MLKESFDGDRQDRSSNGESVIIVLNLGGGDPSHPERIENRVVANWFEELKARVK